MFSNKYICEKSISKYATLILLKLSPDGSVEYLNCGHVQPLRHQADQIKVLTNGNLPVGLMPDATYASETIQVQRGERVLVFTDGVTEARGQMGEFYGDDRLARFLTAERLSAAALVDELLDEVMRFQSQRPRDDIAVVVIEVPKRPSTND